MPRQAVLSQEQMWDLERDRRRKWQWEDSAGDRQAKRQCSEGAEELSKDRRMALEARRQRRQRRREEQARALSGGPWGPQPHSSGVYLGCGWGVEKKGVCGVSPAGRGENG